MQRRENATASERSQASIFDPTVTTKKEEVLDRKGQRNWTKQERTEAMGGKGSTGRHGAVGAHV